MPTRLKTAFVFLPLAIACLILYFQTHEISLLLGFVYGSALVMRLPKWMDVKPLFPLLMLFLFLLVLSQVPLKLFTYSLFYTTRALILFRGLLLSLMQIQANERAAERKEVSWTLGLAVEFMMSAVLVYSTFKPVAEGVLNLLTPGFGGILILAASVFTPLALPGFVCGVLSFWPETRIYGMIGFGLLAVYESNFSQRSRDPASRVLPPVSSA